MDFGRRLQGMKPIFQRPKSVSDSLSWRDRIISWVTQWKILLSLALVGLIFYSMAPLHFSTGEKCHSVLKGLRNNAFSRHTVEFSLARCGIDTLPEELFAFTQLKTLDLSHNLLHSLPDDFGSRLPNLEILFLSNNAFAGPLQLQKALGNMPKLRVLALRENKITQVPDGVLPSSIEWLILTSNGLSSLGSLPPALRKLMLSNNKLTHLPKGWDSLKKIELLRLANNNIPMSELERIPAALPSVRWLAASDNPAPAEFTKLPGVKEYVLPDSDAVHLQEAVKRGRFLGEGSAGKSFLITFNKEFVIYKQFKALLSSDGRIESEIALAAFVAPKGAKVSVPQLQQIRGITLNPLGVIYSHPESRHHFQALGKPPSMASCTRDVYPSDRRFAPAVAARVLADVAEGLRVLHEHKVVHGDVYAHNIQYDPATGEAMLIDLGAGWRYESDAVAAVDVRAYHVLMDELLERLTKAHQGLAQVCTAIKARQAASSAIGKPDWVAVVSDLKKLAL